VRAAASTAGRALGVANASVAEAERLRPFDGETERQAYFEASLAQAQELVGTAPLRVEVTQPVVIEEESSAYDPTAQASAGQLITWVFIPLLGTSELFAFERARGTLRRLLTTPTRSATFLLGTITGQLGQSIVQMTILVAFAAVVMHLTWSRSLLALAVMLLAFALAAVAFGTMLGTFVKTESQASGLSIMLGMAMALLGGCWYPIELYPEAARTAVQVLPTTWAMQGLTDLSMRGLGLVEILPEAGVLLGFAVVFFVIGVRRFKFE
jgi:ABC-2 type transport system permease protein